MAEEQSTKITFLLLNLFGMGGTVRTVINTANQLARHDDLDVSVISVFGSTSAPHFPLDPRVSVSSLHTAVRGRSEPSSLRGRALRSRVREGLGRLLTSRARLFHPDEEAFELLNAVIDRKLIRAIRRLREGILVSTRPGFNLLCATFAHPTVSIVAQEHLNFDVHAPGLQRAIVDQYPRLDLLVVLTRADEQRYGEVLGGTVRVVRIPNALPEVATTAEGPRSKLILAAGRLVHQKGFDLLLKAFEPVARQHPDWRLRIRGDGPEAPALRLLCSDLGLEENVDLLAATDELHREMADSSIFVFCSRFEGFGMVLGEAMATGLPAVSFDCPHGPAEMIDHGRTGLLVAAEDVAGLTDAILRLIENPGERRSLGQAGRESVARFRPDEIGRAWVQVLRELDGR